MTSTTALLRKMRKALSERERGRNQGHRDLSGYRNDPIRYCYDHLRVKLTTQQETICQAVVEKKWLLVPSANETGKSFIQACLASWHYDAFDPGLTIITGPVHDQIRDTVFAELRLLRGTDSNFAPSAMRLESGPKHWIKGYTARSATAFHGRHEGSVFVIFEEAEDIASEFWIAADSMAHYFAAFYNPILSHSEAAVRERGDKYHIISLNAFDHPNITAQLENHPPPFPKAITLPRLKERLDKWATKVSHDDYRPGEDVELQGVYYRPGPIAEARVLGRRPKITVGSVFTPNDIDKVNETVHEINPRWPIVCGVDVARFGDDYSSIHVRQGLCSIHHESHNGWNEVELAEKIMKVVYDCVNRFVYSVDQGSASGSSSQADPRNAEIGLIARRIPIQIDDAPCGGGVQDILRSNGYKVVPINSASTDCTPEYPNIRSQLWFDATELARSGLIDWSRLDDVHRNNLTEQLLAPQYEYDVKARKVVEPKKRTKSALGRSPDDADAMLLCYFQPRVVAEYQQ